MAAGSALPQHNQGAFLRVQLLSRHHPSQPKIQTRLTVTVAALRANLQSWWKSPSTKLKRRSRARNPQTLVWQATVSQAHPQTARVTGPSAVTSKIWQRMMKMTMMTMRMTKKRTNRVNYQTLRSGQRRKQRF